MKFFKGSENTFWQLVEGAVCVRVCVCVMDVLKMEGTWGRDPESNPSQIPDRPVSTWTYCNLMGAKQWGTIGNASFM